MDIKIVNGRCQIILEIKMSTKTKNLQHMWRRPTRMIKVIVAAVNWRKLIGTAEDTLAIVNIMSDPDRNCSRCERPKILGIIKSLTDRMVI